MIVKWHERSPKRGLNLFHENTQFTRAARSEDENGMVDVGEFSFAYSDQLAVARNGLHELLAGARPKRRNAKVAALADLAGREGIHRFRGKGRQELRGWDQGGAEAAALRQKLRIFERMRLTLAELPRR